MTDRDRKTTPGAEDLERLAAEIEGEDTLAGSRLDREFSEEEDAGA